MHQIFVRPGTGCEQLRGCPPAFGFLLDAAAPFTSSAWAEKRVGVQRQMTSRVGKSRSMVYSAQRHQGGVGGPRPPRGTAAELSTPSAYSVQDKDKKFAFDLLCPQLIKMNYATQTPTKP